MKPDKSTVIILLVFSLFCGILIISLGLGAELPILNRIAGPMVCSSGQLSYYSDPFIHIPGQSYALWSCINSATGQAWDARLWVHLVAGSIYGLAIFALFMLRLMAPDKPKKEI